MISQFFSTLTRLFLTKVVLWFLLLLTFFNWSNGENLLFESILCSIPFYSLIYSLRLLFLYERSMSKYSFSSPLHRLTLSFQNISSCIISSIIFNWILIWYWEKTHPGEYGIALKWNFPFSINYWRSNSFSDNVDDRRDSIDSFDDDDDDIDDEKEKKLVQIKDLVKQYSTNDRIVLNHLTFDLYENEITALLGHNGAGSTFSFRNFDKEKARLFL